MTGPSVIVSGAVCLLLLQTGCRIQSHLPEDTRLLSKNKIDLVIPPDIPGREDLRFQAGNVITRKPNTKVLGLFDTYLWFHFKSSGPGDTTRWDKFIQENLAEPPVYVDQSEIDANLEAMLRMLRNRGFFQATGTSSIWQDPDRPKAEVTYHLNTGRPLMIERFSIVSNDPGYEPVIPELQKRTLFKPGLILNSDLYHAEATRITRFLRERGYAFFFLNQVSPVRVEDTDTADYRIHAVVELLPDPAGHPTRPVSVQEVNVLSSSNTRDSIVTVTNYKGIRIRDERKEAYLRPEVLYRALTLRPDSLYTESAYDKSNRRLSSLGIYRFISLRTVQDSFPDKVNLFIQLTPTETKVSSYGIEANNTTAIGDNSNVLGISGTGSYTRRNLFRRGMRLDLVAEPGVEFNFQPVLVNAANGIARAEINFPFFEDYFGFWRRRKRSSFLGRWRTRFDNDARSTLSFNYTYNNLLQYWEIHVMNLHYGFRYSPVTNFGITVDHFQVDYYRNELKSKFEELVPEGFKSAFEDQFLTGFLFRNLTVNYIAPVNKFGESWSAKAGFEQSGLEILGLNTATNLLTGRNDVWAAGNIGFAKYLRADSQLTYSRKFGKGRQVATRLYTGLILPLADDASSPYVKQFSAGGPSSMRGWFNGELGPGRVVQTQDRPPFFSRGDIKLEGNVEWRQSIFWILEGAAFLDAGNVWNLREKEGQEGGSFKDFYKEFAVAGGLGIRLNFQYFIIVYDVGAKLRYPYRVNGAYWARKADINFFNLQINYPF